MNRRSRTLRLTRCALFTALIAVLAQIQLPLPPVPLSLALLAVHLTGLLLGPKDGALAVCAYVLLGLCGLPVFAGFASGPSVLLGPTGGYLVGYAVCAAVSGWSARRFGLHSAKLYLGMTAGMLICSALGGLWLMAITNAAPSLSFVSSLLIFLPGDAIKIILAAALARRLEERIK